MDRLPDPQRASADGPRCSSRAGGLGPALGGTLSSTILTLLVIPAVYSLWKEWEMGRVAAPVTGTVMVAMDR
jgi:hypothetical protein